ncbi:MAG TPA: uroporphyrin-III methyltransferase [Candidatus Dietzia intestinipullorum]|nr:uroporphyrin-III methyltransferase [Candidatus Dietzia intestinipullorum]
MRYPPVTSALASPAPAPALDGLPLTVGLSAREVLLVGGGPVSARRARTFLEAGALVRVVAPELAPEMESLAARAGGAVVVVPRAFTPDDLDTPWMVHVATGDPEVDAEVAALCERQRIWCVTAGDAALGSARVPARTAVSTPSGPVRIAVDSGDPRRSVRVGRHVARSLATEPAGLRARRREDVGWAALVGDCGDGDLLTIRARRLIHAADVLVVDGAADPGLLGELDDDVEVAEVGPSLSADQATALVAARTAAGNGVVRLVPATALAPASRALEARGVAFQVVPGVVDGAA